VKAAALAAALLALHAVRGDEPRIEDAAGRQVLLRGVNVNQLGDYYRASPALDPVVALGERDFAEIAELGMNSVRLIVHWSALEPSPGAFDAAYLARIRQAVGWAKAHGIYVVLDMHQDAWGKHVATPPGETCAPGFSPALGWDGAPAWATLSDGLPTCKAQQREIAPAVAQAWQSFYGDRGGIQQRLVATWARLAGAFAGEPAVAGYDLINEPNPGFAPVAGATVPLGAYYQRAIAAIRAAGGRGIVFFEPGVEWSAAAANATPPPAFVADPNVVFAPHLYAGSITVDRAVGVEAMGIEDGFTLAERAAAQYGTTVWSGEWGWFGDPAADEPSILRYAAQEDAHRWGGAWWDWRQACGDPHNFAGPGAEVGKVSPSLHRFACPAQTDLGIPATTRRILARAYPRAAPGRLTALRSDPRSRAFSVRGTGTGCGLDVWVPGERAPVLSAHNVLRRAMRRAPGGWRVTGCTTGAYELASSGASAPSRR
jgi:endoglycosylceramidase